MAIAATLTNVSATRKIYTVTALAGDSGDLNITHGLGTTPAVVYGGETEGGTTTEGDCWIVKDIGATTVTARKVSVTTTDRSLLLVLERPHSVTR